MELPTYIRNSFRKLMNFDVVEHVRDVLVHNLGDVDFYRAPKCALRKMSQFVVFLLAQLVGNLIVLARQELRVTHNAIGALDAGSNSKRFEHGARLSSAQIVNAHRRVIVGTPYDEVAACNALLVQPNSDCRGCKKEFRWRDGDIPSPDGNLRPRISVSYVGWSITQTT